MNIHACRLAALLLLVALLFPACEKSDPNPSETTDYVEDNGYSLDRDGKRRKAPAETPALAVTPTVVNPSAVGDSFTFTASGGVAPYEWNVANATIGAIQIKNGNPCVYVTKQLKNNSVWVKDARGQVATASVQAATP